METNLPNDPRSYLVEYFGRSDGVSVFSCMDDRPPEDGCWVLGEEELYYQYPGGLHGVSLDVAVAQEAAHPGWVENRDAQIHNLAKGLVAPLRREKLKFTMHEGCAAFLGSHAIAKGVYDDSRSETMELQQDSQFVASRGLYPDIRETDYERYSTANGVIAESGLIVPAHMAARVLKRNDREEPRVPHAHLSGDHNAIAFIANYLAGTTLDVRRANENGAGAYQINFGEIPRLAGAVNNALGIDLRPEGLLTACAVRVAQIRQRHLLDPNDERLPILLAA